MATNSDIADGTEAGAWGYTACVGAEGCPPRCPRLFDKEGTLLRITPGVD